MDSGLTESISILIGSLFNVIQTMIDDSGSIWVSLLGAIGDPSFLCILGSRLLVNLKEAGELGVNQGTSYRLSSCQTVSEMEFKHVPVEGLYILHLESNILTDYWCCSRRR